LEVAKWKLDHGDAPFEEAEKEWNRNERLRQTAAEVALRQEEEVRIRYSL
jgi:hypothetical protein